MADRWKGRAAKAAVKAGAVKGLGDAAEHVLGEARKLVPIEEGTLERSGVASVDEGSLQAAVSFDTPYAVRQHEELDYAHDAGRQAKYLETARNQSKDQIRQIIADRIRASLRASLGGV